MNELSDALKKVYEMSLKGKEILTLEPLSYAYGENFSNDVVMCECCWKFKYGESGWLVGWLVVGFRPIVCMWDLVL